MTFNELADALARVRADPLTDDAGNMAVQTISAQAARLYVEHAARGAPGFDPALCDVRPHTLVDSQRAWNSVWEVLAIATAVQTSGLPDALTIAARPVERHERNGDVETAVIGAPLPGAWRLRADNYRLILLRLATMAGEPGPGDTAGDNGMGAAAGTAADGGAVSCLTHEQKAIALLVSEPHLTDTQIAQRVGVNRTAMYRWTRFVRARKAQRAAGREHRRR